MLLATMRVAYNLKQMKHRPILIKAKPISETLEGWIEGNPVYKKNDVEHLTFKQNTISIDEGTICLFTGLHDSDKKRIFENDMIVDERGKEWIVYWSKQIGQFRAKCLNGPGELMLSPLCLNSQIFKNALDEK